ncbi:MAG TPA: response regulator, partial [Polyangiales bacterium]|nr:response regulator [Polyangiales bacterium]
MNKRISVLVAFGFGLLLVLGLGTSLFLHDTLGDRIAAAKTNESMVAVARAGVRDARVSSMTREQLLAAVLLDPQPQLAAARALPRVQAIDAQAERHIATATEKTTSPELRVALHQLQHTDQHVAGLARSLLEQVEGNLEAARATYRAQFAPLQARELTELDEALRLAKREAHEFDLRANQTAVQAQSLAVIAIVLLCVVGVLAAVYLSRSVGALASEMEAAAEFHRDTMAHSIDVVCIVDDRARILQVSDACERLWGYTAEELIGKSIYDLVHPEDRVRTLNERTNLRTDSPTMEFTNRNVRKDGSTVLVMWSARWSPKNRQSFAVARDVTERERAAAAMREAKEAAEAANRAKSDFLANMSHEIRTPMNGVLGAIDLLLHGELAPAQRELANLARGSGEILLTLINDILDFAKIEAGKLVLEVVPFDLLRVMEEVASVMAMQAHQKGITLVLRCAPELPRQVQGDPSRLRQVLINLVSNAIKFTSKGHVFVNLEHLAHDAQHVTFRLEVEDTGIGIAEDKLGLLFEKFTQADASTTRRFGGTGLGLAISKQLVEMMGGTIGARSKLGEGSTFFCELRLSRGDVPEAAVSAAELAGLRMLVVDDNAINRRVLHEQVVTWGLRNGSCGSAHQALQALRSAHAAGDPYRVALIDHQMPDIDGEMLAILIKGDAALRDVVLIMLSSSGHPSTVQHLHDLGVAACLTKPVRQSDLLATLREVCVTEGVIRTGTRSAPAPTPASKPRITPKFDAHVLVAEDNTTNQILAAKMLGHLGCTVDLAGTGEQALRMLDATDYDMIFMDCEMPAMDGFQATAEIRKRSDAKAKLPIVAVTAKAMEGDRARCL